MYCNQGTKIWKHLKNYQNSNLKPVLESVLVTDSESGVRFWFWAPEVPYLGTQKCQNSWFWVPGNYTFCAQKINLKPVLESVTETNSNTGFRFSFWAIFWFYSNLWSLLNFILVYIVIHLVCKSHQIRKRRC